MQGDKMVNLCEILSWVCTNILTLKYHTQDMVVIDFIKGFLSTIAGVLYVSFHAR